MFVDQIQINAIGQYLGLFTPSSRVFLLYLVSAAILGFFVYRQFNHEHDEETGEAFTDKKSFLAYLFDKDVFLHKSTWQDVKFFLVNAVLYYGIAAQFLIGTHGFSVLFSSALQTLFGAQGQPIITSEVSLIIYTILSVIAIDLGVYLTHYMQHKIPFLWEFHKVHHSAEKLTPVTLFRMHPVDLFITSFATALLGGLAFAGLFYMTGEKPEALTLFGLNVIFFTFYIVGYNLRHSHIWMNYPVWLSKIFISPAQHQIHHSSDPKHFDRNFGLVFSFWDQLLKTHYIPRRYEKLSFGLSREEPNPFRSVAEIYWKPFAHSASILNATIANPRRKVIVGLALVAGVMVYYQTSTAVKQTIQASKLPTVHVAKLTWTEVEQALEGGFDTILIPTAGVEQNGPHVILGKHNVVVARAAHDIAHALGKTLVAPVIDHVPEGDIEPEKTGHMRFSGTISVPVPIFEGILKATARSMKAHGFKQIYFIGDSLGNQESQAKIADLLQSEWQNEGIKVAHIGDYYAANGQFEHLLKSGYTKAEIGFHAGIRDTSEVLYINPNHVRGNRMQVIGTQDNGVSGVPAKASAEIGKKMVDLKVQAAIKQIQSIRQKHDTKTPIAKLTK